MRWMPRRGFVVTKKTYTQKLLDPRWQRKRLEKLQAEDFTCELCGDSESTLHVHHKGYFVGRDPWDYEKNQLAVLCNACHEAQHDMEDVLADLVSRLPLDGPYCREEIANLIAGYTGLELATSQFHFHTEVRRVAKEASDYLRTEFALKCGGDK